MTTIKSLFLSQIEIVQSTDIKVKIKQKMITRQKLPLESVRGFKLHMFTSIGHRTSKGLTWKDISNTPYTTFYFIFLFDTCLYTRLVDDLMYLMNSLQISKMSHSIHEDQLQQISNHSEFRIDTPRGSSMTGKVDFCQKLQFGCLELNPKDDLLVFS